MEIIKWYDRKYKEVAIGVRLWRYYGLKVRAHWGDFDGWDAFILVSFSLRTDGVNVCCVLFGISVEWIF